VEPAYRWLSSLRVADLSGLPPQWWSLRSTTRSATRARRTPSGWPRRVRTEVCRFDGLIHGFFTLGPVSEAAQTAIDESLELSPSCSPVVEAPHGG